MNSNEAIEVHLQIPFPSRREAEIAFDVLRIDSEPKRSFVQRSFELQNNIVLLELSGKQAKNVRVAVTSFFEALLLCCDTLEQFGAPVSEQYDHY
ncbi:uncharacterized protein LOC128721344 [Anopheles nili]|uniref:uncharacterized protein LOC128721344 n=1 Tax=Anopheles nili TaxID=185578 RepID=UPI00237A487F|nr:uncharacterized protein LOC128721344 [Anopheles nili]